MDRQKIVVVQAHPDDELLWAWPVMQRLDLFDPVLVLACQNTQGYPKAAAAAVSLNQDTRGVWVIWGPCQQSNFYQLPTRRALLTISDFASAMRGKIQYACDEHGTDLVWTHNPVGEYGHGDHRLLWELVCTTPGVNRVLFSDICIKNKSHISYEHVPPHFRAVYGLEGPDRYIDVVQKDLPQICIDAPQKLDLDWFNEGKQVYQDHRAWSWNNPVPETCNVCCIDL